jgi:biopolymer transport protein ExbB
MPTSSTTPIPTQLIDVWLQGDLVTRAVALLLLLMSLASWSVMLRKAWELRALKRQARATEAFWHSEHFEQGLQRLGDPASPFHLLAQTGSQAVAHHRQAQPQLHDSLDVSDWVTRELRNAIEGAASQLQAGLSLLASVGTTAPFVGLFGTVWGIHHALIALSNSTDGAALARLGGPLGEALVMTAFGLAVAIPAVLGFNALSRSNRRVLRQMERFAHDLHAYLVTGSRLALDEGTRA